MTGMDVLGLSCTAVDDVVQVASTPGADETMSIDESERRCGGLTGAALVKAARLGAVCANAGCLGLDDLPRYGRRCPPSLIHIEGLLSPA